MAFVLLGTQACHLCEEAQALLLHFQGQIRQDLFLEDIAESEQQVARYGERIPVLLDEDSGDELGWPFDLPKLEEWLRKHKALH
ncbi:MAG: glutaredoxin family protein [Venatoribacter sp.]